MLQRLTKWIAYIFLVLLLGAFGFVVAGLVGLLEIKQLTLDRFIELAFLLGLFGVTAIYTYSTNRIAEATQLQAKASGRAVDIALNAERNAVTPIIKLLAEQSGMSDVHLTYWNVGRGPVLNLQIWISHQEFPHLSALKKRCDDVAVGLGEKGGFVWRFEDKIPVLDQGANIMAQYEDIFRTVFESRLEFVSNGPPILHWGQASQDKRIFN